MAKVIGKKPPANDVTLAEIVDQRILRMLRRGEQRLYHVTTEVAEATDTRASYCFARLEALMAEGRVVEVETNVYALPGRVVS